MAQLRIFLMADYALLRAGLKMLIDAQADMSVIGEARSGNEVLRQMTERPPDILVMDLSPLPQNSVAVITQIQQSCPQVHLLALTHHSVHGYPHRLLRAGVSGYVINQGTTAHELMTAIRIVAAGGTFLFGLSPTTEDAPLLGKLTRREVEVLRLIAWGQTYKEIAKQLEISIKTVERHRTSAGEKLHLYSRADILRYALSQGWLQEGSRPE